MWNIFFPTQSVITAVTRFSSPQPLKEDKFVIPKSRYDTIDCFLASAEYNDMEVLYDKDIFKQLKDGGGWSVSPELNYVTTSFNSSHNSCAIRYSR